MRCNACNAYIAAVAIVAIAASPAFAVLSYFETVSEHGVVEGPPYPTACHTTEVAHEAYSAFECDGRLDLSLARALDESGSAFPLDLHCLSEQVPGGGFQSHTAFDLMFDPEFDLARTVREYRVDLRSELVAAGGRPGKLDALRPELLPNDPNRYFDIQFSGVSVDVMCRVTFDHGIQHELTMLLEPPAGITVTDARIVVRSQTLDDHRRDHPALIGDYFSSNPDANFDVIVVFEVDDALCESHLLSSLTYTGRFLGGLSPVTETSWAAVKAMYGE